MTKHYLVIEYDLNGVNDIYAYCQTKTELLQAIENAIENGIIEFTVKRKTIEWKNQDDMCTDLNHKNNSKLKA